MIAENLSEGDCIIHPELGNLCDVNAVLIPPEPCTSDSFEEHRPYYVHLSITGRCNAKCAGCVNSSVTFPGSDLNWLSKEYDTNPVRDATAILKLLTSQNEREAVLSFYGGEPLLLPDSIDRVISVIAKTDHPLDVKYMVYTNGQLLGDVIRQHPNLICRIWLWSISIDGTREQHNSFRPGTDLDLIHQNLIDLKPVRTGDVLMWSTLREDQSLLDCFREYINLNQEGLADHFFWHWMETGVPFDSLPDYAERYEHDLETIMDAYISQLSRGILISIIHINELILYLLTGKRRGTSACGVEKARNFDIMGGKIHPCADLPLEYAVGTIDEAGNPHLSPFELNSLVKYKEMLGCYHCGVHPYCGGRCPVQALAGGEGRLRAYCQLMRLHVGIIQRHFPEITRYIDRNNITLQQIYDQSAFFAQFTDVTP